MKKIIELSALVLLMSLVIGCGVSSEDKIKTFEGDYTYDVEGTVNMMLDSSGLTLESLKTASKSEQFGMMLLMGMLDKVKGELHISSDSLRGELKRMKETDYYNMKIEGVNGDTLMFANSRSYLLDRDSVYFFHVFSNDSTVKKESIIIAYKKVMDSPEKEVKAGESDKL